MSSKSSTPTDSARLPEYVAVGRAGKAHGIRGEVWVEILSDVEDRFEVGVSLSFRSQDGRRRDVTIETVRPHKGGLLIAFEEVWDRNDAEKLQGGWLEVSRDRVPRAPEEEYYHFELIGCLCEDSKGESYGEVVEIIRGSGGELLEISDGERKLTVPFVEAFVREIQIDERRLELELPPGFLEICGSGW